MILLGAVFCSIREMKSAWRARRCDFLGLREVAAELGAAAEGRLDCVRIVARPCAGLVEQRSGRGRGGTMMKIGEVRR